MKIPHFRGVFMRDTLPKRRKPTIRECWILNLNSSNKIGTHWVAVGKFGNLALYYDSMGKLPPPLEVLDYLGGSIDLYYNTERNQNYGTTICGHLCLKFLNDFWRSVKGVKRTKNK